MNIATFGGSARAWAVPEADLDRQAIAPLRGYAYQIHQCAAAWIRLGPDDALFLEVAEDFAELLQMPDRIDQILRATQVKDTRESGAVTLNSADVLKAIDALWRLRTSNSGRSVRLTFLTTSKIGQERKMPLASGVAGLAAWQAAAQGGDVAEIRAALLARLAPGELRRFVESSPPGSLRTELLASLTFACGAQDWRQIEENNRNALVALRDEVRSTADMAYRAYDALFGQVVAKTLGSADRRLDRQGLIACLERATAIALPSQVATRLDTGQAPLDTTTHAIELTQLKALAQALLEAGTPPSVALLYPDAPSAALAALDAIASHERTVVEIGGSNSASVTDTVSGLLARPELKHLIVGPPGSGKSHALWRTAERLLKAGDRIPLFLPVAQLDAWTDVLSLITDLAPHLSPVSVLSDPRVCVCIDGWSEFATGEHARQRRKALSALHGTRVIANGKFTDTSDAAFKAWSLELLAPEDVAHVLRRAHPGEPEPPQPVLDLLRLPLLLSIHAMSYGQVSAIGELLRQFHEQLSRDLPQPFTDALCEAVADTALAGHRSFGHFASQLRTRAGARGIPEPLRLLQRLGTIRERGGQVLPVHDLYWSWLAGRGLLSSEAAQLAIGSLHTRDSYLLALQSGMRASSHDVDAVVRDDLVLAAMLQSSRLPTDMSPALATAIEAALGDVRLAVRSRGALAVLEVPEPMRLRRALEILSELARSGVGAPECFHALRPDALFPLRAIVADWLGADGSSLVLDAIAERGGPEWVPWLEQVASAGKIPWTEALAAALGCSSDVPGWGRQTLDELVASTPWKLRAAAKRRSNVALARVIARDYERLLALVSPGHVGWIDLNRVLVACGDAGVFRSLLECFEAMGLRAQEHLGYAVVDRGAPWISAFQRIAFSRSGATHHHKLADSLSLDIDDATARQWIANGHDAQGWRVLIARHGNAVLPELVADLPVSFAGLHHIPALANMEFLENAPLSLVDELWQRFGNPMQPKATQDALNALATVYPAGMASIVRFIADHPDALPAYHLHQVVRLYEGWRQRFGADLGIQLGAESAPFPQWIGVRSALQRWEDHFTPKLLAASPDVAVGFVLEHLRQDESKAAAVLGELRDLSKYSDALLNHMLAVPSLAALVPGVFAECFDNFPLASLQRCLECPHINQEELLYRLGASGNPLHRPVHAELISTALGQPLNLHHFKYIANMLRGYPRHDAVAMLEAASHLDEDKWLWLAREVETARGERLLNDIGSLRH